MGKWFQKNKVFPTTLIVIFFLITSAIIIAGLHYYNLQYKELERQNRKILSFSSSVKLSQIVNWLKERRNDAELLSKSSIISEQINKLILKPSSQEERKKLLELINSLYKSAQYESIKLVDVNGNTILAIPNNTSPICPESKNFISEARKSGKVIFSVFFRNTLEYKVFINFYIPIKSQSSKNNIHIAVLILQIDPYNYFYPMLNSDMIPELEVEFVLLRQEGDNFLYLNELKKIHKLPLTLSIPAKSIHLHLEAASEGKETLNYSLDYKNAKVLTAVKKIPGTKWFLVANIDSAKIFEPLTERTYYITAFIILLLVGAGLTFGLIWMKNNARNYKKLFNSEVERRRFSRQFQNLLKYANDIILLMYPDGKIIEANEKAMITYGYTTEELLQLRLKDITAKENETSLLNRITAITKEDGKIFETFHKRKDGSIFPVEVSARFILSHGNNYFQAIIRDITDRKKAEEALSRYRSLIEQMSEGIMQTDIEDRIQFVNSRLCNMLGYREDELVGCIANEVLLHHKDYNFLKHRLKERAKGITERYEIRVKKKSGGWIWVEVTSAPIYNENNEVIGSVALNMDITERKLAGDILLKSEKKYRDIVDYSPIGIYQSTTDGRFKSVNASLAEMLGYDNAEDLMTQKLYKGIYYDENESNKLIKQFDHPNLGSVKDLEVLWKKKDGTPIWILLTSHAIRDKNGETLYYDGFVHDITERKKADEELLKAKEKAEQSDHLKSEFLAQMSHEIRSPLNIIIGATNFLQEELKVEKESELPTVFSSMKTASNRIIRTIDSILNMSQLHAGAVEISLKDVNIVKQVLEPMIQEFRPVINEKKNVNLTLNCWTDLTTARADEYCVTQIFSNLIDNAIKYTHSGEVNINVLRNDEDKLVAEVNDTGIGIAKEFLPYLFEPFRQEEHGYSRSYDGNGLGLALVKSYCELNNITIEVESEKGKGSTFRLIFNYS